MSKMMNRIKIFRYSKHGKKLEQVVNDFLEGIYLSNAHVHNITTCTDLYGDDWEEVITVHYEYIPTVEELKPSNEKMV